MHAGRFSHIVGEQGAYKIRNYLLEHYGENGFALLVDEGGFYLHLVCVIRHDNIHQVDGENFTVKSLLPPLWQKK